MGPPSWLGVGHGTDEQRLREVVLLSLEEEEAKGILQLFATALQGDAARWSQAPLTGTW